MGSPKAKTNKTKHGASFEDAATVFKDPKALTLFDEEHSEYEKRWITLGLAASGKLLVVCHTYKEIDVDNAISEYSQVARRPREKQMNKEAESMKKEYEFSKAERGKFYRPDIKLNLPVYLDDEAFAFVDTIAKMKNNLISL